jgi:phosphoglycerol transferase MdoB-like AlkP superfamily enzyme
MLLGRLFNKKPMGLGMRSQAHWFSWVWLFLGLYLFLVLQRGIAFIILKDSVTLDFHDFMVATQNGVSQDLSVLSYFALCILAVILLFRRFPIKVQIMGNATLWTVLSLYLVLVYVADHSILYYWGEHLNQQAIAYLNYPKQLLSSLPIVATIVLVLVLLFLGYFLFRFSRFFLNQQLKFKWNKRTWWCFLILIGTGIIFARGGTGKIPLNITSTFKSAHDKINVLSINAFWNSIYHLFGITPYPEHSHFTQGQYSGNGMFNAFLNQPDNMGESIFNDSFKPPQNVMVIVMEGVSAQTSKAAGGQLFDGLVYLDSWAKATGVMAKNCYATSDRTDKGLVSIFSGWPGQPWQGILHEPNRFKHLPHVMRDFQKNGFHTSFVYGGDMDFVNLKAYMKGGGAKHVFEWKDIPSKNTCNWGVNDADVLKFLYEKLKNSESPFLGAAMLLSSHEPYDVVKEKTTSEIEAYFKSVSYVDKSIHDFLSQCFNDPAFDQTWFVILSDHGKYLNTASTYFGQRDFFKIPFAIIGKNIPKELNGIEDICFSQTDIYNSLLDLCFHKTNTKLKYSRSIFRKNHPNMAWFNMHEVAGIITQDEIHWLGLRKDQIQKELPLIYWDSVILSMENEILTDFFRLGTTK